MLHAKFPRRSQPRRRQARGSAFTLVELLVIAGVMTVLVALLLPALTMARAAATQIVCANNLRQQYMAHLSYASEHKDWLMQRRARAIPLLLARSCHLAFLRPRSDPDLLRHQSENLQLVQDSRKTKGQSIGILSCPTRDASQRFFIGTDPNIDYVVNGEVLMNAKKSARHFGWGRDCEIKITWVVIRKCLCS